MGLNAFRGLPRQLWLVVGGAVALRLLMLPFIHPWDGNTFHNLFAQLAAGQNPYVTFWDLTLEARARPMFGYAYWYEYYAYPPLLIYLYWPLAQLAAQVVPLTTHFYVSGQEAMTANVFPWAFLLLYKLPIWLADVSIMAMLWCRTRSVFAVALYGLNPLVLVVSGAWMFDAIPAAFTLGAFLLFEREHYAWSGGVLALGFLAKFYPMFLLPVFFMALVWRRDARAFRLVGAFAATSVLLVLPFYPEILHAFAFNAGREGGGLSLFQLAQSWLKLHEQSLLNFQILLSPALGSVLLLGGMGLTYALLDRYRPRLEHAVLLTLLAFLLFTKLVNEQYALWLLPFLALRYAEAGTAARVATHLLWAMPFAYMLVHVPITAFIPGGHPFTTTLVSMKMMNLVLSGLAAVVFAACVAFALWANWPREREEVAPA